LCLPVLPVRKNAGGAAPALGAPIWSGSASARGLVLVCTEASSTNVSRGQLFSFPSSLDHL
jgi:hypothetical protein